MKKIWELYENMNEVVYVTNADTYDLVYMNRKARELCGVQKENDLKKCYQVLQRSALPCSFCNSHKLRCGFFDEWKYANPILKRTFLIKDTLIEDEGTSYRMEIAIDITKYESDRAMQNHLDAEAIVSETLRLSMLSMNPYESIDVLLEYLGKSLHSDRVYIFEKENECFDNTYEWCADGVVPQKDNLQKMPFEDFELWMDKFATEGNVIIPCLEDTKETDPEMYKYLVPQDIQSLVVSPFYDKDEVIGFWGVDNPPAEFVEAITGLLKILSHFILSTIRRRELYEKLEHISYYDELTQFGNRHLLNSYVDSMKPSESIGVVYCDIMGLKHTNDNLGHEAGDALILRAGKCLREIFEKGDFFRLGGDEFLVLNTGITEEGLDEKMKQLRKNMKEQDAMMAVGEIWRPDSTENIDTLLALADGRMYEDKRAYYADNSRSRRTT